MSFVRPNIAAMSGYQPGEQPQAGKFIKLNTNENPYSASPAVAVAIRAALDQGLEKYPDALATSFRVRAGEVLGVDPDWILCGNGSDDILTIVTRTFVGQDDLLRLPYPSYILYRTLSEIQAARFEEVQFDADWKLGEDFAADRDRLRLAYLPNPNSPSGTVLTPPEVQELAGKLPCPLLVDEAYVDFAQQSCLELVRQNANIMVSRTLSKSYALAGLRFGFLVAQPALIQQLLKVKDSYNCDTLSIAGATGAIDDQAWLQENRAKIITTRQRMSTALEKLGFSVVPSQANFVWCTHSEQPAQPLYEALKRDRILIRYMDYRNWGEGLRISVGTDDQVDACLSQLGSTV
ncbi:MAG: histidinol-phosphate transaminase [Pirellulaceae bacterium]|jgi:histidinol-phosphate aminotransferase|nr:histidinol-phosphate transaminase [Pirellulaceae bacterium]MDP6723140.1 histidinol-phosphate transaminase [Pirellulaceae bacterium]